MPRDINAEASKAFFDAVELVAAHYGLTGHQRIGWALLVYPDEAEPSAVNIITPGTPSQVAHALLAARAQMLDG